MHAIDGMACAKRGCDTRGKLGLTIVGHGSFPTKWGRRWRYRCTVCGGTGSTHTGTAYSGLRCARRECDQVASLRVEGVSISATARVTGHSRNTIARWLERASTAAKRFNQRMLRDVEIIELQADELCTFIVNKSRATWLCAAIEVCSRLWAGSVLGRRASRNATAVLNDVIRRGRVGGFPLIATDGFEYYVGVSERLFGSACVYGPVLKTRRTDRVVRVERRRRIGTAGRLQAALWESEDSETLHTSFVERLTLTIRPGSAYLRVLVPVAVDSPRRYTGAMNAIDERACGKPGCDNFGKPGLNIVGHGWFVTKSGRRRRYRCTVCGGTLSTNTGTAYRGLRCSRREFDQVASLRVEGVSISATARVTGHSRTTIARWLERAATAAACFNHRLLRDFDVIELQADELCTFIGSKRRTLWLFATIEVCSRLWAGSVLGRRSHRNTKAAINDVILRGRLVGCPLIATDGFEYYVGVMVRLLGSACVYGQVLKTRRNNRVVRVERRVKIGTESRLNAALLASEDSETLNTSFIERLNLTIRQGSAYLRRRSPCHARGADQLRGHVELLRCYYNFIRPHRALRFGRETRTPAMQAGLVSQRLALRDIFTAGGLTRRIFVAVVHVSVTVQPTESDEAELSTRCSPSARRQAA